MKVDLIIVIPIMEAYKKIILKNTIIETDIPLYKNRNTKILFVFFKMCN